MKVLIITSMEDAPEIVRIKEELTALNHECLTYDVTDFDFKIIKGELIVPGITNTNPDVILVRGILKHLKPLSSYIKRLQKNGTKVFDNNFLNHKYSISKVTDLIKLSMSSIPVPDTMYVKDFDAFYEACEQIGYPAIIKSVRSGQGKGVHKVDSKEELTVLINEFTVSEKKPGNYIIQQFFEYEKDLRVLVIGHDVFAMRRIPREGDFRANFSLGGTVEKHELTDAERELALRALSAVEMSVAGVDVLVGKNGELTILEVNHTAGMTGMEEATGENITKVYVEHVLSEAK